MILLPLLEVVMYLGELPTAPEDLVEVLDDDAGIIIGSER